MRIGLYGGTFDPIHNAHLIIAEYVKEELDLQKVIFVPSAFPPHKQIYVDAQFRFEMVKLATSDNLGFTISDVEMNRQGVTYSVDTIAFFKDQLKVPREHLFWIIGSDNLFSFHRWKSPEKILQLCTLVVFPRSRDNLANLPEQIDEKEIIYLQDAPFIEISSTTVRQFVQNRRSIKYLVPPAVEAYILSNKLYM
ncbi:MAG: nicotinate-nucleotide adenylyltransferase [bacterium]